MSFIFFNMQCTFVEILCEYYLLKLLEVQTTIVKVFQ